MTPCCTIKNFSVKASCSKSKTQHILDRCENNSHQLRFQMDQMKRLWGGQLRSLSDIGSSLNSCIKTQWRWGLVSIVVARMEPVAKRSSVQHMPLLQHGPSQLGQVVWLSLCCRREQGLLLANQSIAAQDETPPSQSTALSWQRYLAPHRLCVLWLPDQDAVWYRSVVHRVGRAWGTEGLFLVVMKKRKGGGN